MGRRTRVWWIVGAVVAGLVASAFACSYVALPFGWTINFPGFSGKPIPTSEVGQRLKVPPGFAIDEWAGGIRNARFLLFTPAGDLLVSSPQEGTVFLLERDASGDARADGRIALLTDLDRPHGLAYRDGWLYVAETGAVLRVRFDPATRAVSGTPERIVTDLPPGGNHWTRTISIGPDGKLYVSIGSSCNVCIEQDRHRAAIVRYDLDGKNEEIFATGLRNSVGLAWQPGTGDLWATDNGRDLLGDDFPPCELNRIVQGGFYGWPIANGNRVPDPNYGKGRDAAIAASIPPVHGFAAHTAPLGITFYDYAGPGAFPERYRGAAFVALHGSWNRSKKIGYEVVALFFRGDEVEEEPFVTGFLEGETVHGRPVDVAVGPDGALYVSDDFTGSIYRVAYGESAMRTRAGASGVAGTSSPRAADVTTLAPRAGGAADPLAAIPAADRPAAIARGQALWEENHCARCHVAGAAREAVAREAGGARGAALAGAETVRPLAGLAAKYDVTTLAKWLVAPQPPMPAFPLGATERRDVAAYVLSTYP